MKTKIYLLAIAVVALFAISAAAYAKGTGGPPSQGDLMMGGGHGGMGGNGGGMGGQGMMGWGRGISALWEYLSKNFAERDQNPYDQKDTEELRKEIKEKRKELASMVGSSNKDEKGMNKKIDELNRLELELDIRLRAQEEK